MVNVFHFPPFLLRLSLSNFILEAKRQESRVMSENTIVNFAAAAASCTASWFQSAWHGSLRQLSQLSCSVKKRSWPIIIISSHAEMIILRFGKQNSLLQSLQRIHESLFLIEGKNRYCSKIFSACSLFPDIVNKLRIWSYHDANIQIS